MKKILTYILLVVLGITLLLPIIPTTVFAGDDTANEGDGLNYAFSESGNFYYTSTAKQWHSGYRLRTAGVIVHKASNPSGDPMSAGAGTYRIIPEYYPGDKAGNDPYGSRDDDTRLANSAGRQVKQMGVECKNIAQDEVNDTITVQCVLKAALLKQIISEIIGTSVDNATPVFFSNLFQVSDSKGNFAHGPWADADGDGVPEFWGKVYTSLDDIRNPSGFSWSKGTYDALATFFNHKDYYKASSNIFRVILEEGAAWSGPVGYKPTDDAQVVLAKLSRTPGVISATLLDPPASTPQSLKDRKSWSAFKDTGDSVWLPEEKQTSKTYKYVDSFLSVYPSFFLNSLDSTAPTDNVPTGKGKIRHTTTGIYDLFAVGHYSEKPPTVVIPVPVKPDFDCTVPAKTTTTTSPTSMMDPTPTGMLLADTRGASKFDVSKGIPTTEDLYANLIAKPELMNYTFIKYTGKCTWKIAVTKPIKRMWTTSTYLGTTCDVYSDPPNNTICSSSHSNYSYTDQDDIIDSVNEVIVERPYSFWAVDKFAMYQISGADVTTAVLNGGKLTIAPKGITTSVTLNVLAMDDHYDPTKLEYITLPQGTKGSYTASSKTTSSAPTVDGSDSLAEAKTEAEKQVKDINVKNDNLVINGATIMNSTVMNAATANPATVTQKPVFDNNVLYSPGNTIPTTVKDDTYPTQGSVSYTRFKSYGTFPATVTNPVDINDVTVRTPVVNYSTLNASNVPYDQTWGSNPAPYVGVLGRDLKLDFTNSGQHLNIPGYGNKDYTKYTGTKRMSATFPAYVGNTYYPANSWIPVGTTGVTLRIPEWAPEGINTVRTESWAINSQSFNYCGTNYNGTLGMECAVSTYNVNLVGRAYGFTVYDIGDFRYENVFRTGSNNAWSGFKYASGLADYNGNQNSIFDKPALALPVRPGSHPTQVATTPHNGYPFSFYFNTVGEYWKSNAGVTIIPSFRFVPKSGGNAIDVDLYYNTSTAKMIKVGGPKDTGFKRTIKLSDPLRAVSSLVRQRSLEFEYDNLISSSVKAATTKSKYVTSQTGRITQIATGYSTMNLNYTMRTLIGPVNSSISASEDTQLSSVQRWFGEYSLPIAPYIVAKGTNLEQLARTKYGGSLTGKESEFLKGGYIIVNFQIYPYKNGTPNAASIAYDASSKSNANMWSIEKEIQSSTNYLGARFNYKFGDIIMFESDFSVKDDYRE